MNIQINGKPTALAQPCTIATLLQLLGYHDRFIAVARNREHVRRSDFDRAGLRGIIPQTLQLLRNQLRIDVAWSNEPVSSLGGGCRDHADRVHSKGICGPHISDESSTSAGIDTSNNHESRFHEGASL